MKQMCLIKKSLNKFNDYYEWWFKQVKITTWNANNLLQHYLEVKIFFATNLLNIFLVSETTLHKKNNITKYQIYHTMLPDGTAHGGSAIFITEKIRTLYY